MTEQTTAAVAALARRLGELEDRAAIAALTARYNAAFDAMDVEGWTGTFAEDGEFALEHPRQTVPPTAGRDRLRQMQEAIGYGTVHLTSDHLIELDGDVATQRCTALLAGRSAGRETGSVVANTGRYRDELVRTAEGWRFRRRTWIPDAESELPSW